ncbi:unnamed protein product [Chrysodeixis includens]|uniref:Glutathione S-transferase n=1 Tax=Chrysodeixis includens TaxID=689277 RepID=A0A9N8KQY8_CHRIL|nr:unnamed protein product [Chrysodeixis includens]
MAPILYKIDLSPPANAVRMLAHIIGLQLELKDVAFSSMEHKSPEYVKKNPMGQIPTLDDGGFILGDSHAIMIYLLSKYGGNKSELLYPSDAQARAVVNQVLFFDASILFSRIKVVTLPTVMGTLKSPSERHLADIEEAYGMLEAFLSRHSHVAGDHLTIADLAIANTLYAGVLIKKLDAEKFPLTTAWYKKMQEEPSYKEIAAYGSSLLSQALSFTWQKCPEDLETDAPPLVAL